MGDRNQETDTADDLDDFFDPVMADASDDDTQDLLPMSTEKQRLAAKRRRISTTSCIASRAALALPTALR